MRCPSVGPRCFPHHNSSGPCQSCRSQSDSKGSVLPSCYRLQNNILDKAQVAGPQE